jgi:hypothetical protein
MDEMPADKKQLHQRLVRLQQVGFGLHEILFAGFVFK